jgi:hypothetical protein
MTWVQNKAFVYCFGGKFSKILYNEFRGTQIVKFKMWKLFINKL